MKNTLVTLIFALSVTMAFTQDLTHSDSVSVQVKRQDIARRHSIGSSIFLLGNLPDIGAERPVYYGQLSYGYLLTPKDNIVVEANTWTYYEPLGTYGNSENFYPGKVRAIGIGVGYQRFLWKNMFASATATPFLQQFYDEDDNKIQDGFQLYLQFMAGNRFEFFKKRWFVEPAIAYTCWPVNTNFPASFKEIEKGKPGYKIEPRANFGYRF
jgi:hypothetical protein